MQNQTIKRLFRPTIMLMTLMIVGCSGGGTSDTPTTEMSAADNTSSDSSTTDNSLTDNTATENNTTGADSQGTNPGTIPGDIIGEVLSLDVSNSQPSRGYKVFAGGLTDSQESTAFQNAYTGSFMNIEFPCNGFGGSIEFFPSSNAAGFDPAWTGTFYWDPEDPAIGNSRMELVIETTTSSEIFIGEIVEGNHLDNKSLIVGTSAYYGLIVDRIVQYEICN